MKNPLKFVSYMPHYSRQYLLQKCIYIYIGKNIENRNHST